MWGRERNGVGRGTAMVGANDDDSGGDDNDDDNACVDGGICGGSCGIW